MNEPNNKTKLKKYNPKFQQNYVIKEHIQIIKPLKNPSNNSERVMHDWNLYLPDQSYDEFAHFNGRLRAVEGFFCKYNSSSLKSFSDNNYFTVNINKILKDNVFLSHWSEFMNDLINSPKTVIGLFAFTMVQLIKKSSIEENDDITDSFSDSGFIRAKLNPRFVGLPNYLAFKELKLCNYGKFVSVIGTVIRVNDVKPYCTYMAFMCVKCRNIQVVKQNKGCYTVPHNCIEHGCFCCIFKPLLNSKLTQTIPLQNIKLQELNTNNSDNGRIPRMVECELTCDLTDSCIPGDTIIVSGIVTTNSNERKATDKDAMSYILHICANSVVCLKGKNVDSVDFSSEYFELKLEDLGAIQKIHSEDNLFRLLVASLSPNIYGHEIIKAGLILSLFSGEDKSQHEGKKNEFSLRENSHVLIVGDPGLGKSQMLLACANVSPRGVYICGNSTSSCGLTVTISRDGGENSLEAGALVLANRGHCCIDEFDKMIHHHSALLEAMEQQTISIAKSGVVCTLPARTSILAAANPSGGHYNKAKTVSENLRIGRSLLSRFDLLFIIQDEPDQNLDSKMSRHVMGFHSFNKNICNKSSVSSSFASDNINGGNLLKKLRLEPNEKINFIPPAMLQKYISYSRKFAKPTITSEASKLLQDFYLDMRKQHKLSYSTLITIRLLQSLIRLTQARAKTELREFCTKTDAEDVIEIMKFSMSETYSDEFGNLNFKRSIHGSKMSIASQAKILINMMTKAAQTSGDNCFTKSEIQYLSTKLNISSDSLHSIIETLNYQGYLLKKGHQLYQIQTL